MERRQYLSLLGAATVVPGCTAPAGTVNTESPPSEAQRKLTVEESDRVPDQYAVDIEALVENPYVTPDRTVRIRIETTNRESRRAISYN